MTEPDSPGSDDRTGRFEIRFSCAHALQLFPNAQGRVILVGRGRSSRYYVEANGARRPVGVAERSVSDTLDAPRTRQSSAA